MRKLCVVRLFSRRRAESWTSVRDEIDNSIASVVASIGQNLDVGGLAFSLMTNVTYRAAFGARSDADQAEFGAIVAEFSRLFGAFGVGDMFPWLRWWDAQGIKRRMKKARAELDQFINRIIDEHLAKKPKEEGSTEEVDMVDDMIAFLDENEEGGDNEGQESLKLSRDNIKGIIMDVMFGGTETVASVLEWAMSELLKHPSELLRAQQELAQVVGLDRKVKSRPRPTPVRSNAIHQRKTLRLPPPMPRSSPLCRPPTPSSPAASSGQNPDVGQTGAIGSGRKSSGRSLNSVRRPSQS
ncbi:uncharacterized protein A4U43_C01F34830 [Asparagus officinalis]|uniref:Cytochrome P450 n=1 Tax=Asparagus officinalis TaxID=4686 RepID=A0A5P1FUE7_ASPOF|nr:uncharacterized protein A4U43_C01F34830 [Asparagus officinalis]